MGRGQFLDATGGWMQPQLQFVEDERALHRDRQLAIENKAFRRDSLKRFDDVREVTRQRLPRFRLQENFVAVAKRNAAKAVPLRLVLPLVAGGNGIDGTSFHRSDWWFHAGRMTNDE